MSDNDSQSKSFAVPIKRNPAYKRSTAANLKRSYVKYSGGGGVPVAAASRDATTNFSAQEGDVPLTDLFNETEWYGNIYIGTPGQLFQINFDTGSSDLWVRSTDAPTPSNSQYPTHNKFDSSKSSSFGNDGRSFKLSFADAGSQVSGVLGRDLVLLGNLRCPGQILGLANKLGDSWEQDPADGILGLGFDGNTSVKGIKTVMDNLISRNSLPSPVFSVALSRHGAKDGEILFGGINQKLLDGNITYIPVISNKSYWKIAVDNVWFGNTALTKSGDSILDTGSSDIRVPAGVAAAVYAQIPGSKLEPNVTVDPQWLIPANADESAGPLYFEFRGTKFAVPIADLKWDPYPSDNNFMYGSLQPKPSGTGDLWIFGGILLKNVYAIFDQGKTLQVGLAKRAATTT